jgi:hypothetical protein
VRARQVGRLQQLDGASGALLGRFARALLHRRVVFVRRQRALVAVLERLQRCAVRRLPSEHVAQINGAVAPDKHCLVPLQNVEQGHLERRRLGALRKLQQRVDERHGAADVLDQRHRPREPRRQQRSTTSARSSSPSPWRPASARAERARTSSELAVGRLAFDSCPALEKRARRARWRDSAALSSSDLRVSSIARLLRSLSTPLVVGGSARKSASGAR